MDRIERPKVLASQIVDQYLRDGYWIARQWLALERVDSLKREMERIITGHYAVDALDKKRAGQAAVIYSPQQVSREMHDHATDPRICSAIAQLAAAHRVGWDGSAKCVQMTAFLKPPGQQGHAWHQDDRSIPTWDQSLICAWTALDDTTRDNGCLRVIPGSHRMGFLYPLREHQNSETYVFRNEAYGFDESQAVNLEVPAGSVIFFSGSLLHGSLPNRAAAPRRVIAAHYCNAWVELPYWDGKKVADLRSVIPVSGVDPYAEKGYDFSSARTFVEYRS